MTNAEARFNNSLRPRKPVGSLGRTAQDVHLDSHTAPELCWGFNRGDLNISASAVPNNKDTYKTKRNGKLQHIKLFKQ